MARKSGVTWARGSIPALQVEVRERADDLKGQLVDALEQSVAEGGGYIQDALEAAVTRTGIERSNRGRGTPGRHDSGNMVGSVSYDDRGDVNTRARVVWMRFGWWGQNYESYFRDQDLGEGRIPAARALPTAFFRARENFRQRIQRIVRGRGGA